MDTSTPTIFISYTGLDVKIARAIRNLLEDREHEVLLLKLAHHMDEDYLRDLLRSEVEAHDWLVYIDSPNARKSGWVAEELDHARLHGKKMFTVNALGFASVANRYQLEESLVECAASISRSVRAFFSYAHKDQEVVSRIAEDVRQSGYEVWIDREQIRPGDSWREQITAAIEETLERGFIVVFVSANSISSPFVQAELDLAIQSGARIIPCLISPKPRQIPPTLAMLQYIDLSQENDKGLERLKSELERKREDLCGNTR